MHPDNTMTEKQTGRINILIMYHETFFPKADFIPKSIHLSVEKALIRNEIPRGAKIHRVIPGPCPGVFPVIASIQRPAHPDINTSTLKMINPYKDCLVGL